MESASAVDLEVPFGVSVIPSQIQKHGPYEF